MNPRHAGQQRHNKPGVSPASRTMTTDRSRVLIVGTYGGGGVHQYVEEQHRRLRDRLPVESYDMAMPPGGNGVRWFLTAVVMGLWAALKFPFRTVPGIIHVHTSYRFSFYRSSFYVLFARYVWRRPVILHVHGSSFDEFLDTDSRLLAWYQAFVFDASNRVVVLSPYWADAVAQRVDRDRIVVLPNAVEPDNYDPVVDHETPHIVFVSNLIERKGVPELVAAIDRLKQDGDRDFRVSVAGDGPLSDRVEALADRYEDVTYHGYVSEERKRSLLNNGSIYILPTHAEGLPIAMLEGMAGGNAIVSTTVGSIPEVISDENGVLVSPGNVDELQAAIATLVDSPDRVREMSKRNRAEICDRYAWDAIVEELLEVYRGADANTAAGVSSATAD